MTNSKKVENEVFTLLTCWKQSLVLRWLLTPNCGQLGADVWKMRADNSQYCLDNGSSTPNSDQAIHSCSMHQTYSSLVSPFQANTGTPVAAIAAAAASFVEKMLQLDHCT